TKDNIQDLMDSKVSLVVGKFDRFLFYWSGHGDQMVRNHVFGYLPLANSKRDQYYTMISMQDIQNWNDEVYAQQTLFVLDACLSGLAGSEAKGAGLRQEQLSQESHQLLTAGTEKENVISGERWTGSLFTDSFIEGAKGAANHPQGIVSL